MISSKEEAIPNLKILDQAGPDGGSDCPESCSAHAIYPDQCSQLSSPSVFGVGGTMLHGLYFWGC